MADPNMNWTWVELETKRFQMGSDRLASEPDDDEGPTRLVTVGSLAISARCVSNSQFASFIDSTGYVTQAEVEGSGWVGEHGMGKWVSGANWRTPSPSADAQSAPGEAPVFQVSWTDAQEFCHWSHTQLPTEAQWARASPELSSSGAERVWQWCEDFYHPTFHRTEQRVNPTGPTAGLERVLRGGGSVVTERHHAMADFSSNLISFRVIQPRLYDELVRQGRR